eukprot:CAMPEP_0115341966 /NCGR_PEP_ID=MMETSP0270-20121206/91960_1 /TAXON_ID=71861 /ORGANISM="Scrippsiella trochoidea, Strain CCMP3099" /LENGTH=76 /DNA_ID=CAMNT_0002763519 /DNA_START=47 /DNA_END=274 /DNA_ORIENTATION=+
MIQLSLVAAVHRPPLRLAFRQLHLSEREVRERSLAALAGLLQEVEGVAAQDEVGLAIVPGDLAERRGVHRDDVYFD